MRNNNDLAALMLIQNEIRDNPFEKAFIKHSDDALRYINDCNNYLQQFDDHMPEEQLMKQIVNKLPNSTRRLYRDWCRNVDDNDEYEPFNMEALTEYIRTAYPFPNSLYKIRNNIDNIHQRFRELPGPIFQIMIH
eukprot:388132_1